MNKTAAWITAGIITVVIIVYLRNKAMQKACGCGAPADPLYVNTGPFPGGGLDSFMNH